MPRQVGTTLEVDDEIVRIDRTHAGSTSRQVGRRAITRSTQEPFRPRLHLMTSPDTVLTLVFGNPRVVVEFTG